MTVLEILNWSTRTLRDHRIENPRLNAELLLARVLNLSKEELYAAFNGQFKKEEKEALERLIERRISGEPLQYILGHQEFWSIDFKVDPRVLIPRPETELLVEQSVSTLSEASLVQTPFVLEIGTGSGAIAISLAKEVRDIFIAATDISREALLLAKENAKSAGVLHRISFVNADLLGPFRYLRDQEPFDLIVSNPPYIDRSEIQRLAREIRDYEPIAALDGGEDGMEFYRRIISQAPSYLRRGGWLLLEVGEGQGEKVADQLERSGYFLRPQLLPDLSGIKRVVKTQKIIPSHHLLPKNDGFNSPL
jgi:release factor glutamine methyltransferase